MCKLFYLFFILDYLVEGWEYLKEWLVIFFYYDFIMVVLSLGYIYFYGKIIFVCKIKLFIILVEKK